MQASQPQTQPWGYYTPAAQPERLRRVGMSITILLFFQNFIASIFLCWVDWLRERVYFEGISKDNNYARQRLGYSAPNVFIMDLIS